eukprot:jgi/Mesvir1/2211/Mv09856-RA.1
MLALYPLTRVFQEERPTLNWVPLRPTKLRSARICCCSLRESLPPALERVVDGKQKRYCNVLVADLSERGAAGVDLANKLLLQGGYDTRIFNIKDLSHLFDSSPAEKGVQQPQVEGASRVVRLKSDDGRKPELDGKIATVLSVKSGWATVRLHENDAPLKWRSGWWTEQPAADLASEAERELQTRIWTAVSECSKVIAFLDSDSRTERGTLTAGMVPPETAPALVRPRAGFARTKVVAALCQAVLGTSNAWFRQLSDEQRAAVRMPPAHKQLLWSRTRERPGAEGDKGTGASSWEATGTSVSFLANVSVDVREGALTRAERDLGDDISGCELSSATTAFVGTQGRRLWRKSAEPPPGRYGPPTQELPDRISVRVALPPGSPPLTSYGGVVLKCRGDGSTYALLAETSSGGWYGCEFKPPSGRWTSAVLMFESLRPLPARGAAPNGSTKGSEGRIGGGSQRRLVVRDIVRLGLCCTKMRPQQNRGGGQERAQEDAEPSPAGPENTLVVTGLDARVSARTSASSVHASLSDLVGVPHFFLEMHFLKLVPVSYDPSLVLVVPSPATPKPSALPDLPPPSTLAVLPSQGGPGGAPGTPIPVADPGLDDVGELVIKSGIPSVILRPSVTAGQRATPGMRHAAPWKQQPEVDLGADPQAIRLALAVYKCIQDPAAVGKQYTGQELEQYALGRLAEVAPKTAPKRKTPSRQESARTRSQRKGKPVTAPPQGRWGEALPGI